MFGSPRAYDRPSGAPSWGWVSSRGSRPWLTTGRPFGANAGNTNRNESWGWDRAMEIEGIRGNSPEASEGLSPQRGEIIWYLAPLGLIWIIDLHPARWAGL